VLILADLNWNTESALIGVFAGGVVGILLFMWLVKSLGHTTITRAKADADKMRASAEADVKAAVGRAELEAEKAIHQRKEKFETESNTKREELRETERRLAKREDLVDRKLESLTAKEETLDRAEKSLRDKAAAADAKAVELDKTLTEQRDKLLQITGLSIEQAKGMLLERVENEARADAAKITRKVIEEAEGHAKEKAREITLMAVQRFAAEHTAESTVRAVPIPSDDMKGRIIGREGRNIRAFESVTGVNLIIDDTPEAVLLSCFDPVRREIGRLTLERLVTDGRIHPQRIEEAYERGKAEIEQICQRAGEDAMTGLGITDMHPELVSLLGRLRYRTSYGQNVLAHLTESAYIAGMMASELGLNPVLLRRCAVLHDIGKALTHEVEGSHALIGAEIARKYGESDDVVHAIEAHHNEVEVRTVEAVLTQAADAISGGRPGARRESLEMYVRRLERLEQIAVEKEGVEKVFAMQAGREIRVMVKPEQVDDIQAQVIARDIAKQVEEELTYPGQIRVTVVRESRATEFAR